MSNLLTFRIPLFPIDGIAFVTNRNDGILCILSVFTDFSELLLIVARNLWKNFVCFEIHLKIDLK